VLHSVSVETGKQLTCRLTLFFVSLPAGTHQKRWLRFVDSKPWWKRDIYTGTYSRVGPFKRKHKLATSAFPFGVLFLFLFVFVFCSMVRHHKMPSHIPGPLSGRTVARRACVEQLGRPRPDPVRTFLEQLTGVAISEPGVNRLRELGVSNGIDLATRGS